MPDWVMLNRSLGLGHESMASTHLVGVFLTVLTYRGPQLIYHYFDPSLASVVEEQKNSSGSSIEWSDDDSLEEDSNSTPTSPALSAAGVRHGSSHGSGLRNNSPARANLSFGSSMASLMPNTTGNSLYSKQVGINTGIDPSSAGSALGSGVAAAISSINLNDESSDIDHLTPIHQSVDETRAHMPCGFEEDVVADILSPPESLCNKKFSLMVENCMFVGIPVHILESGTWRPLKEGYLESVAANTASNTASNSGSQAVDGSHTREEFEPPLPYTSDTVEYESVNITLKTSAATSPNTSPRTSVEASPNASPKMDAANPTAKKNRRLDGIITEEDSPMRMFHVCFVSDPPINEAATSENRIYENVLVPLVRILRQEQASKNYVWKEAAKMQRISEMTTNLSVIERQEALEANSELARALRDICGAIANMEIARVMICNKPRAFQVPLQLELSRIPGWYDEVSPQAYLSTSNSPTKEIGHDCYECYGLLLLGDPEVIVKEIDVDPKGPVAVMIRNIDPTSSLEELAKQNHIEIKQIVNLVWSLVYWRRARIIIPLNYRHIYSVSPLASTQWLNTLSKRFHDLFPVIPPLQRFLSLLSTSKPKPFSMHVPSADHRPIYMRALAWLLQNDLVVHLPTFAQILVTRKIKLASMNTDEEEMNLNNVAPPSIPTVPSNAPQTESSAKSDEEGSSGAAVEIADDTIAGQLRRRKWLRRQSSSYKADMEDIQESIIIDPRNASPLEKRWLAQVAVSGVSRSPELAALFQRLTKYFNKQDNIEQMMVREKIPREEMRRLLQEFQPYILTYRHW